jgi:hypothetical protein
VCLDVLLSPWSFSHEEDTIAFLDFSFQIDIFTDEVCEVAEIHTKAILRAGRSLATAFTAHSLSSKLSWPNVTLPFFELRTKDLRREQSGVEVVVFAPLVSKDSKEEWEAYSIENQGWLQEGLDYQGSGSTVAGRIPELVFPSEDGELNLFAPLWQIGASPTNASIINLNLLSIASFDRLVDQVLDTRAAVVSQVINLLPLIGYEYPSSDVEDEGEEGEEDKEGALEPIDEDEPRGFILQPVYESFEVDASIVGVVITEIKWSLIFRNDELIRGMFAVLDDSCGTSYTYFIDEGSVDYIGKGDLHERRFNYLGTSKEFGISESEEEGDEDRKRKRRTEDEYDYTADGNEDADVCEV